MRRLCGLVTAVLAVTATEATLPIGQCIAHDSHGVNVSFHCQFAAFGAYMSETSKRIQIVLAPDAQMLGCAPFSDHERMKLNNTAVIVRRGECSFQRKLNHVAATGANIMILVNANDGLVALSSLEYEQSSSAAMSIAQNDGNALIVRIQKGKQVELTIEPMSLLTQARARLQYLKDINAPVVFFEEFYDIVPQLETVVGTLDKLLSTTVATDFKVRGVVQKLKMTELLDLCLFSAQYLAKWHFASEATLYATIAAAVLHIQLYDRDREHSSPKDHSIVRTASLRLMEAGYYASSASLLRRLVAHSDTRAHKCLLSFLEFLQGDVVTSLSDATICQTVKLNSAMTSLKVAQSAFNRLIKFKRSRQDEKCLGLLTNRGNATQPALTCCSMEHRAHLNPKSRVRHFSSAFTRELFDTLILMGVFLDEVGSFTPSLSFFEYAARLCPGDQTTLKLRQLVAIPIIFSSQKEMNRFLTELETKVANFTHNFQREHHQDIAVSPLGHAAVWSPSMLSKTKLYTRPEHAAYLEYTITPPTMFIGYQGTDVRSLQSAIYKLRSVVFPSLSSPFSQQNQLVDSNATSKRRVGFISSWFRAHSVGKLLLGVVQKLDRRNLHVSIYHCVHFLYDADDVTAAFKRTADEFVELPHRHEMAVQLLREAQLEIAIFPELGMDEWTLLLSHQRVAPIQCVFWGHPITTDNPHIDYFISSEHFVPPDFDKPIEEIVSNQLSGYRRSAFSEHIVLFRGLSTVFTEPKALTTKAKAITRSQLHLPPNRRLYMCLQTLMKFHPAFDEALNGILLRDDKATIVLLASKTQFVWMEQLRRRFRQHFGQNHRRVLFLPTLPFEEFQALLTYADVVLDPFPFGGGVSTLDALHLGIPVVTLPAAQSVVNLAAGFLRYMNASDCIAHSLNEYIQLAVRIAMEHEDIRKRLLSHRSDIFRDTSTIADWNTFLTTVTSI